MSVLAINGGTRVRSEPYPAWPQVDQRDADAVANVVLNGQIGGWPEPGPRSAEFAARFAGYQGASHGIVMVNGTVTMEVALKALGDGVNKATASMGVALTSCTVPAAGKPTFQIGNDEMEMGVGIHGEPGRRRVKLASADAIAAGALRGYRDTAAPMLIAAIGYWGIGFAGGWTLAFPLGYGAVGMWWGLAVGLAVVAGLLTLRLQVRSSETRGRTASVPQPVPG